MTKCSFSAKGERAKQPLGLVHSDVCGPLNVKARGGYEKFQEFQALAQNQLGKTLKILRTNRGGEYMDMQFKII